MVKLFHVKHFFHVLFGRFRYFVYLCTINNKVKNLLYGYKRNSIAG